MFTFIFDKKNKLQIYRIGQEADQKSTIELISSAYLWPPPNLIIYQKSNSAIFVEIIFMSRLNGTMLLLTAQKWRFV